MNTPRSIPRLKRVLWIGAGAVGVLLFCAGNFLPALAVTRALPVPPRAAFDYKPMTSLRANPTITGSATSSVPLDFKVINKTGSIVYENPSVLVISNRFSDTVYPPIANGTYTLMLQTGSTTVATSTLTIGLRAQPYVGTDNSLSSYDVADGHLMRFTVRARNASDKVRTGIRGVSITQLTFTVATNNADVEDISLYAYTDPNFANPVGSSTAPLNSVPAEVTATSTTVTIVPDTPIEIPSGATYYFDLLGTVTPSDVTYEVSTTLLGDSHGYFAAFQDLAPADNFIWSPNTYATTSVDDPDWINGDLVVGIPAGGLLVVRTNPPPTDAPACNMDVSTTSAAAGTPVTFTWSSTNAVSAKWDNGAADALQGTRTYTQGSTTHTYILNFYGPHGFNNCYATVAIPYVYVAATTTTAGATTTPTDGFTATPLTGNTPLAVTFTGSVNNAKSCALQTYSFSFGEGATSTITVAKNLCKAQSFTLTHTYTKAGTFTAGLYSSTGTSSKQRIQTLLITPKVKVAGLFSGSSNVADILSAFDAFWQWIKNTF